MARKFATFNDDGSLRNRLDSALHVIPDSAVEIDEAMFFRLTQEIDGVWQLQSDGAITKGPLPERSATVDELAARERTWRDTEVSATEWLVNRHRDELDMQLATTLTSEQFAELLTYRQALRDWPQSEAFPDIQQRPIAPAWVADQNQ